MECNKEEATRARDLAERKLSEKDYTGAHKIALKARKLYPNLENLTQIVTVCEVHCATIAKVNGETDWYGILQVGTTADDQAIRKAYRKLALLLHPDKNKFVGAEAAFKLIGEANGVLTDKGKRSLHDMKRNNARVNLGQVRRAPAPAARATRGSSGYNNNNVASNGSNSKQNNANLTFWTMCSTCGMRYQYFRSMLKKALRCQNCLNPFIAYEADEKGKSSSATGNGVNPKHNLRFDPSNGTSREPFRSFTAPTGVNIATNSAGTGTTANGDQKFEKVNLGNGHKGSGSGLGTRHAAAQGSTKNVPPVKPSKRKRVVLDEEESEDSTESSGSSEDETILKQKVQQPSSTDPPRRSSRQRQNVSYTEKTDDLDDDFDVDNGDGDDDDFDVDDGDGDEAADDDVPIGTEKKKEAEDPSLKPRVFTYNETDFFNFETLRERNKFKAGDVWAVYDDCDGMPRFYARIKSMHITPKFSIRFSWFEVDPEEKSTTRAWLRAGLPIATGTFKRGDVQTDDGIKMFSHVVSCGKGSEKNTNTVSIYPRKGEVWAMFKNWDINWSSKSKSAKNKKFEYEMVQVVSDVTTSTGFFVMPLVKINGFVSIFMQSREAAPVVIPSSEVLRFSHSVPLHHVTDNERGLPEGALELDPASLPPDLIGAFTSTSNGLDLKQVQKPSSANPLSEHKEEKKEGDVEEISSPESPDGEFYRFSDARSIENVKPGQIWALYSDIDTLPKYYAMVKSIDEQKESVLIKWLEADNNNNSNDNSFPFGCGIFRVSNGAPNWYDINAFSHQMAEKPVSGSKNLYDIKPAKNETWAVYRNWNGTWSAEEVKGCRYDLVRISEVNRAAVKVSFLDKVVGKKAVFRLNSRRPPMEVPNKELAKFSHRIPAYEISHHQIGCWVLDTEALPESLS